VDLAGAGRAITLDAEGDPVLAIVVQNGGNSAGLFAPLTARERQVAALVARGLRNRDIADELVLSLATVKDHVHSILLKTGLKSRAAVAAAWHAPSQSA